MLGSQKEGQTLSIVTDHSSFITGFFLKINLKLKNYIECLPTTLYQFQVYHFNVLLLLIVKSR